MRATRGREVVARRSSIVASILAILCFTIGPVHAQERLILDEGHTDIFSVSAPAGQLALDLREDVTGHGVVHDPAQVELHVSDAALLAPLPGPLATFGDAGYVLPLVQRPGILWPGWDTSAVAAAGLSAVTLRFVQVTGPGVVSLATTAGALAAELAPLLADGGYTVASGAELVQPRPGHVHAYWVFSAPGVYTLTVEAQAGALHTAPKTYTFTVGDEYRGAGASAGMVPTGESASGASARLTGGEEPQHTVSSPSSTAAAADATTATRPPIRGGFPGLGGFNPLTDRWLTTPGKSVWVASPHSLLAKPESPSLAGAPGNDAASSPAASMPRGTASDNVASSAAAAKPSAAAQDLPAAECLPVTAPVEGMTLIPVIHDDTQSPPVAVAPEQLRFGVSSAAAVVTPTAIGNIAAGTPGYMIGSTQVQGVPWLGANTMDPALLAATDSPVQWRLVGMEGPGNVEVFTSGNFGTIVGEQWFSATPGNPSGSVTLPRNTHVHPNWLFSAPGDYHLTIEQRVQATTGETLTGYAEVFFAVGQTTTASDGHYDLGSTIGTGVTTTTQYRRADGSPCSPEGGAQTAVTAAGASFDGDGTATNAVNAAALGAGATLPGTGVSPIVGAVGFSACGIALYGAALVLRGRRL
ncbi:TIGR03773 family transporter-associated surface protein [Corynebacterium choanae]|uniref:Surface-anchored protein n=1 Tax=Corynebacterium choanae TaxID=1862358 RepID=A0A3G6J5H2_9CORY|nr:TIGR03773 family transporter-associated surface protein [Corynebacterium choanae]AZA13341.1 hypothetical protein CCHOA_04665 [Corynebacterium choanae]